MTQIQCLRCGGKGDQLPATPYPGTLGVQILENVCDPCWAAWKKMSVNVINDYKLRPFMPKDRALLEDNMKKFLNLGGAGLSSMTLTGQGKDVKF